MVFACLVDGANPRSFAVIPTMIDRCETKAPRIKLLPRPAVLNGPKAHLRPAVVIRSPLFHLLLPAVLIRSLMFPLRRVLFALPLLIRAELALRFLFTGSPYLSISLSLMMQSRGESV